MSGPFFFAKLYFFAVSSFFFFHVNVFLLVRNGTWLTNIAVVLFFFAFYGFSIKNLHICTLQGTLCESADIVNIRPVNRFVHFQGHSGVLVRMLTNNLNAVC